MNQDRLHPARRTPCDAAFALVTTLAFLVLVTILVVGAMVIARLEKASAHSHFEARHARALADLGVAHAVALIREATEAGSQSGKFWASQPGKITVFNSDGSVDTDASRLLYSTNAKGNTVDLNLPGFDGVAPIASPLAIGAAAGTPAPEMKVGWVPVLADPAAPAGATNRIVGRYAFWVDDENAKLNINTADGTARGTAGSFGPGTPTEVSLGALQDGTAALSDTDARAIAERSGAHYDTAATPRPFNDGSEALELSGTLGGNDFNLTAYSRAPELNLFGEPRIQLLTVTPGTPTRNAMTGAYAYDGVGTRPMAVAGGDLTTLYPISSATAASNQLPNFTYRPYGATGDVTVRLPQFFQDQSHPGQKFTTLPEQDYDLGMRIAQYLKGKNSRGESITWPQFPGSGANGFAGKYTDRQIDSIALQILTLLKRAYPDHFRTFSIPYVMPQGFLSGRLVRGLARGPRINEIVLEITTVEAAPAPKVAMAVYVEWYLPEGFGGGNLDDNDVRQWDWGNGNYMTFLNFQDATPLVSGGAMTGAPSPLGGFWMDNLLTFLDQSGAPAGVDLFGNDPSAPDPDQTRAELYHGYPGAARTPDGALYGSGPRPGARWPILTMYTPMAYFGGSGPAQIWKPGEYRTSMNRYASAYYPMKEGVTALKLRGGLTLGLHTASGSANGWNVDPVPLESLRGPFTGESLGDASVRQAVMEGVIPMPDVTIPIPGRAVIHFQVADPLVNSFPGDWVATVNPPASEITMVRPTGRDPTSYTTGRNTLAEPAQGGDPGSIWWPPQDIAIPKSQRFPSTGYLQYVRTGLMPDKESDALPARQQKGTPYRSLNFAPSTHASQQTAGGESYPDWAMLDLFTTPAVYQPVGTPAPAPIPLTWGGATAGRINPNTPLLPFSGIARTVPLEGLFLGIPASTSYDSGGEPVPATVDEKALASAVNTYISGLGRPLMMAGEICNVPEVAGYLYTGVPAAAQSRNDLVRQIVGNLTTRSNTFTIWALGQGVRKAPANTDYGAYEAGDAILGESKFRVLVERTLDYGADGVPGNTSNPGADGIVGTPDDPVDATYHPAMTYPLPYRYRVISIKPVPY